MRHTSNSDKLYSALESLGLHEWSLKITTATECCWGGEVRLQLERSPRGEADVSTVLLVAGCDDLPDVVRRLQQAVDKWAERHQRKQPGKSNEI